MHRAVGVQTDWSDDDEDVRTPAEIARAKDNGRKRGRVKSKSHCRKCGKEYALPKWAPYHLNNPSASEYEGPNARAHHLRNGNGIKVWDTCTVPEDEYSDGFPVLYPETNEIDKKKRLPSHKKH